MTLTVLSVEQGDSGTWGNVAKTRGKILRSRYRTHEIRHIAAPVAASSNKGKIPRDMIHAAMLGSPGETVVVGHSTEAAYICKAIRDGVFDAVQPERLSFMLLGNPERRYGGWTRVPTPIFLPWQTGKLWPIQFDLQIGIPADIPWKVTDFARRYDIVADAATAVKPGAWNYLNMPMAWITHGAYDNVSPSDPDVLWLHEENISYALHGPPNKLLEPSHDRSMWPRP